MFSVQPDRSLDEIKGALDALSRAKERGRRQIESLKYGVTIPGQHLLAMEKNILICYSTYFKTVFSTIELDKLPVDQEGYQIRDIWQHDISPLLQIYEERLPELEQSMDYFLDCTYIALSSLYCYAHPIADQLLAVYLGLLSIYKARLWKSNKLIHRQWVDQTRIWFGKAPATQEEDKKGIMHRHLACLYQEGTIEHAAEILKSRHAIHSHLLSIGQHDSLLERAIKTKRGSLPALLIDTFNCLFETQSLATKYSKIWAEGRVLKKFVHSQKEEFREFGFNMSILLLSSIFEFGAVDGQGRSMSSLRLALEASFIKTSPFDLAKGKIPRHNLTAPQTLSSFGAVSRAAEAVFSIFGFILDLYEDPNIYPMVHTLMAFLQSLSDCAAEDVLKHAPWTKIVQLLNWILCNNSKFLDDVDAFGVLPEDEEMAGLIFFVSHHHNQSLPTQGGYPLGTELTPILHLRKHRLLKIGYAIANHKQNIAYNGRLFECVQDR